MVTLGSASFRKPTPRQSITFFVFFTSLTTISACFYVPAVIVMLQQMQTVVYSQLLFLNEAVFILKQLMKMKTKMRTHQSVTPGMLEKAMLGDEASFREIYDTISGLLYSICLKYSADKNDASDIFQEGFIKIFVNLTKFRDEGSFEGWAARIMANTCIDHLKKRKKELLSFPEEMPVDRHTTEQAGPEKLFMKDMFGLICKMPHGYRNTFSMFYLDGFNHKEIAIRQGITIGTSKAQLFRAKRYLQHLVGEEYQVAS